MRRALPRHRGGARHGERADRQPGARRRALRALAAGDLARASSARRVPALVPRPELRGVPARLRAMAGRAAEPRLGRPVGDDRLAARRRGAPAPGRPRAPARPRAGRARPAGRSAWPFDEMPFVENPPGGAVVTANNQPEGNDAGPVSRGRLARRLPGTADPRASSGAGRLGRGGEPSAPARRRSLPWLEIRERVLAAPVSGAAEEVRDLLAAWDGTLAPGSPAATAYVISRVPGGAARPARGGPAQRRLGCRQGLSRPGPEHALRPAAHGQLPGLVEKLPPQSSQAALADVAADLRRLGEDPARLGLGPRTPRRPPASPRPQAAARPGLRHRPAADRRRREHRRPGARHPVDPLGPPSVIPSLRAVIDVGNWEASRFSLAGGQSGNPLSSSLRRSPGALPARLRQCPSPGRRNPCGRRRWIRCDVVPLRIDKSRSTL